VGGEKGKARVSDDNPDGDKGLKKRGGVGKAQLKGIPGSVAEGTNPWVEQGGKKNLWREFAFSKTLVSINWGRQMRSEIAKKGSRGKRKRGAVPVLNKEPLSGVRERKRQKKKRSFCEKIAGRLFLRTIKKRKKESEQGEGGQGKGCGEIQRGKM